MALRHPEPEVSIQAYEWASDRLLFPLWRDLLWAALGGLVGFGIAIAVLIAVDAIVGPVIAIAVIMLLGMCGWIIHMRRRMVRVARVNQPQEP